MRSLTTDKYPPLHAQCSAVESPYSLFNRKEHTYEHILQYIIHNTRRGNVREVIRCHSIDSYITKEREWSKLNITCSLVQHTFPLAFTSAPWAIRYLATSTWSSSHASINAVHSSCMKNETKKVIHLIRQIIYKAMQCYMYIHQMHRPSCYILHYS